MSPEQKALVQSSWQHIVPIADRAATLFYDRLFKMAPDIKILFDGADVTRQRRKLVQALTAVVGGLHHLEDLVPEIEALGRRHANYGVRDAHFDSVGAALLWTLEQVLGPKWTSEVREAWTAAYGLIAGVMRATIADGNGDTGRKVA